MQTSLKELLGKHTVLVGRYFGLVLEWSLNNECALHGPQSTAQPLLRGDKIWLLLRLAGREDTIVHVGEGPDGGIGSGSASNGTKLVA